MGTERLIEIFMRKETGGGREQKRKIINEEEEEEEVRRKRQLRERVEIELEVGIDGNSI